MLTSPLSRQDHHNSLLIAAGQIATGGTTVASILTETNGDMQRVTNILLKLKELVEEATHHAGAILLDPKLRDKGFIYDEDGIALMYRGSEVMGLRFVEKWPAPVDQKVYHIRIHSWDDNGFMGSIDNGPKQGYTFSWR